jgi:hypothetical protein
MEPLINPDFRSHIPLDGPRGADVQDAMPPAPIQNEADRIG